MKQEISTSFSTYQKIIMLSLAFIQFAIILDFMIIAPIGDILMKTLSISTEQFGLVVSSYAFSAAISGIAVAGFVDKYDRKRVLLVFFTGFIIGTLLCGLSTTYVEILASRIITGIFAGVTSSAIFTIIADLFAPQLRGRAMSGVQMGFAVSQILGVPLGIFISNKFGWNSSFIFIVVLSVLMLIGIVFLFEPINAHLQKQSDKNPFLHLWHTVNKKQYQTGFLAIMFLAVGGFILMPFSTVFLVNNVHISYDNLPIVFLCTGLSSLVVMPIVGKLSDKFDRYRLFVFGSCAAAIMVTIYTHLSVSPLWLVIAINMLLFAAIMSRMSPVMALNTMVPKQEDRGAYMSISSSLQQIAGGAGSIIAGMIVFQPTTSSPLQHFDILGYVVIGIFAMCIYLVHRMYLNIQKNAA
ncbi:MFS transporter [Undibacterium flavidum]|uniref:MFS transporter n=1 Tax=Undibacterium flavidum TaxID=2762297 RepID=A0ABR6YBR2_9BURK|nr:MFS transporter [Undibacterium flavidum]MBC3874036.1 MFS transporter [Undibacterium flavidum]